MYCFITIITFSAFAHLEGQFEQKGVRQRRTQIDNVHLVFLGCTCTLRLLSTRTFVDTYLQIVIIIAIDQFSGGGFASKSALASTMSGFSARTSPCSSTSDSRSCNAPPNRRFASTTHASASFNTSSCIQHNSDTSHRVACTQRFQLLRATRLQLNPGKICVRFHFFWIAASQSRNNRRFEVVAIRGFFAIELLWPKSKNCGRRNLEYTNKNGWQMSDCNAAIPTQKKWQLGTLESGQTIYVDNSVIYLRQLR